MRKMIIFGFLFLIAFTLGCTGENQGPNQVTGGEQGQVTDEEVGITFNPPANLPIATVDQFYAYAFPFPNGGQEPYYYELGTGTGFPPFGLILDLEGMLSGTPSAEGSRTFEVCAVDMDGDSDCQTVSLNVLPAAGPVCGDFICEDSETYEDCPDDCEAPEATFSVTIDSTDCTYSSEKIVYEDGTGDHYYEVEATGTVTGPEGTHIQVDVRGNSAVGVYRDGESVVTSGWTDAPNPIYDERNYNRQGTSDSETTTWTMIYTDLLIADSNYHNWPSGDDIQVQAKVLEDWGGGLGSVDTVYMSVTCPKP